MLAVYEFHKIGDTYHRPQAIGRLRLADAETPTKALNPKMISREMGGRKSGLVFLLNFQDWFKELCLSKAINKVNICLLYTYGECYSN